MNDLRQGGQGRGQEEGSNRFIVYECECTMEAASSWRVKIASFGQATGDFVSVRFNLGFAGDFNAEMVSGTMLAYPRTT